MTLVDMLNLDVRPGSPAPAIRVVDPVALPAALAEWNLAPPRRTLVLVGGAGGMTSEDQDRLWPLFFDGLAPLAERLDAAIIDGGTDAGVMRLIGLARNEICGTFPLLGVVPEMLLAWPGREPTNTRQVAPAPHHTHFILVPGTTWGVEGPWLAATATALAGATPSATIVINGGAITLQDAIHSIDAGRPVVAVAGSGRTADLLAAALQRSATSPEVAHVAASGQLWAISLFPGPKAVACALGAILAGAHQPFATPG